MIGVSGGKIAAFTEGTAEEEINATGLFVLPGVIDSHVHFNEPGRSDWEGIRSGSRASAAGGTTTFFDMPLNSTPPVTDAAAFHAKRMIAARESHVDFGIWGGLVPGNVDRLEELYDCGAIGLKAFMSHSGVADFPKADPATLKAGMKRARDLGLIVAVHAEIDHPELCRGSSVRDYLDSRPIEIELEAIRLALALTGETGCALHVVHVSSAAGVRLITEARRAGVDATCETAPHYLVLNEDDVERLGGVAKCAPPVRHESERLRLLESVVAGDVQMIASDHSPSPMSMKADADFFKVWGGISGCQHLLPLLLDTDLSLELIGCLTATNVAERFGLSGRKGHLDAGIDADLVLVDLHAEGIITREELFYRHQHSPYAGRRMRAMVVRTLLRGRTIFAHDTIVGAPAGRFLEPAR